MSDLAAASAGSGASSVASEVEGRQQPRPNHHHPVSQMRGITDDYNALLKRATDEIRYRHKVFPHKKVSFFDAESNVLNVSNEFSSPFRLVLLHENLHYVRNSSTYSLVIGRLDGKSIFGRTALL